MKVCPRCKQFEVTDKNPESLFFHVLICYNCSFEEVERVKRPWKTHPEMAELYQKRVGILKY